jgi:hypothetical protein
MTILAHGAAGAWDEVAFLLCPLVFLAVLIIAGRRRRPGLDDPAAPANPDGSANPDGPAKADGPDARG